MQFGLVTTKQRGGNGKNIPSLTFIVFEHNCLLLDLATKGICMNAPSGWERQEAAVFPGYDFHWEGGIVYKDDTNTLLWIPLLEENSLNNNG